jgi:hypothetical protein
MAKLPRKTVVQFGASGTTTDFGQFGSKKAGFPQYSQDPTVLQQLAAWIQGWADAAIGGAFNPFLEDMNAVAFVFGYFIANIFERGIPDWDAGTTYYKGAVVQDPSGNGQRWYSLADNNLGNTPPAGASNALWQYDNPPVLDDGGVTVNSIPKISAIGPAVAVPSALTDDGAFVKTSLPIKFSDNTVQSTAAVNNAVSVQNVVTGSRAANIVYQNTTGKPMFVTISTAFSGSSMQVFCDANPSPSTVVCQASISSGAPDTSTLTFIVLPGYYYKVNNGFSYWTEWH